MGGVKTKAFWRMFYLFFHTCDGNTQQHNLYGLIYLLWVTCRGFSPSPYALEQDIMLAGTSGEGEAGCLTDKMQRGRDIAKSHTYIQRHLQRGSTSSRFPQPSQTMPSAGEKSVGVIPFSNHTNNNWKQRRCQKESPKGKGCPCYPSGWLWSS